MLNKKLLRTTIKESGISITFIAKELGISRECLYQKLNGSTEFRASEIYSLQKVLRITNTKRDAIFFASKSDLKSHI